jgi:hypothetical protein
MSLLAELGIAAAFLAAAIVSSLRLRREARRLDEIYGE